MNAEAIVEAEDRAAGRVISKSRYWGAYWLIAVAGIWGATVANLKLAWWVSLIGVVAIFYTFTLLLEKYKRRSIK